MLDRVNELIEKYKAVPQVYFHCALSQQRGPKAARIYNEVRHLTGEKDVQKVIHSYLFHHPRTRMLIYGK